MFCGSSAYHDGTEQEMSFSTKNLVQGDSVGVQVSENGDVQYYVNGQNNGRVFQHLPQHQDLWGVVFLLYDTKSSQNCILVSISCIIMLDKHSTHHIHYLTQMHSING